MAGAEGLRTVAYKDPVGIPTACFGETQGVRLGQTYTVEECRQMLGQRVQDGRGRRPRAVVERERDLAVNCRV